MPRRQKSSWKLFWRRLLLHPLYIFGVLCLGVLMSAFTLFAGADSYQVAGVVAAAPLTEPAMITFPQTEAVVVSSPLEVTGTCALNSYVTLLRDSAFSGVTQCSSSGTFSITTDLAEGRSQLQAQDYNLTNQAGPASPPVTVDYQPPVTHNVLIPVEAANAVAPETPAKTNNYHVTGLGPLQLMSNYAYQVYSTAASYSWGLDLKGGKPPYWVTADWGDGQSSQYYFTEDPAFTIKHQYKQAGVYTVQITSIDAQNYQVHIQLSAVIRSINTGAIINTLSSQTPQQNRIHIFHGSSLLPILWPSYFTVLLMSVSYWLGQHRELEILRREAKRQHKRRPA